MLSCQTFRNGYGATVSAHGRIVKPVIIFTLALFFGMTLAGPSTVVGAMQKAQTPGEETWISIKPDLFGDAPVMDGSAFLSLEAPQRADDAAMVPVSVSVKAGQNIRKITVIIDENPAPMAAKFTFGPQGAKSISTHMRVNSYSYVRAVAETSSGKLYMVKKFVKATGGCSAPAGKDMEKAMAQLGNMKLQMLPARRYTFTATARPWREAQIMISHPNNSGLQTNQLTMLYIPVHFVDVIEVMQGDERVMTVEGGISLSENPSVRFAYMPNGAKTLSVRAEDTKDNVFKRSWPITNTTITYGAKVGH